MEKPILSRLAVAVLTLSVLVASTGCALLWGGGEDDEALRERAKRVFREQNRVSSRLLMLLPELREDRPQAYERLQREEREMLEACEPLNRIAVARRDEEAASLMDKMNVPATLDECESRTDRVRGLIEEVRGGGT